MKQKVKTKKKRPVFFTLAIIIGVISLLSFIANTIYFIQSVIVYIAQGYTLSDMLLSYFYQLMQPLIFGGGVCAVLFALNAIFEKMPASVAEMVIQADEIIIDETDEDDMILPQIEEEVSQTSVGE